MDLSPNDIRNYVFPNQMRGYSKDEVESFKEQVANIIEVLKHENLKLSMEIESLKSQLAGLKQFEDTIKNAAIDARRNADMTMANAKKEAAQLLSKSKTEAEHALADRSQKIKNIENQMQKIELAKKSYINKVRGLLKSHLELIDDIAASENIGEPSEESLEITHSAELDAKKRETFATVPSKEKGIKTEEAKAAANIVTMTPAQPETDMNESLRDAIKDETEIPVKPRDIDPELAAALESYQKKVESEAREEVSEHSRKNLSKDNVTVTTARAEDVPPEFVAVKYNEQDSSSTDKVKQATGKGDMPMEHNSIDIDQSPSKETHKHRAEATNLAEELDEVVAKFEEELDKAEKK